MQADQETPHDDAGVVLEPVGPQHGAAMLVWMRDPVVARNLALQATPSKARTRAWITAIGASASDHAWAIVAGGRHVGNVVLDHTDVDSRSARLSIYIGPADARGQGLGSAGLSLALRRARDELGLRRVWLLVHVANAPAIALYQRHGFAVERELREDGLVVDGVAQPTLLMALSPSAARQVQ